MEFFDHAGSQEDSSTQNKTGRIQVRPVAGLAGSIPAPTRPARPLGFRSGGFLQHRGLPRPGRPYNDCPGCSIRGSDGRELHRSAG